MKPFALGVLAVLAALALTTPSAFGDQAAAREKLKQDGVAFTPEAFLQKVAEGDVAHTALFLEAGIDPTVRNRSRRTALWIATERKQLAVLQALIAGGGLAVGLAGGSGGGDGGPTPKPALPGFPAPPGGH